MAPPPELNPSTDSPVRTKCEKIASTYSGGGMQCKERRRCGGRNAETADNQSELASERYSHERVERPSPQTLITLLFISGPDGTFLVLHLLTVLCSAPVQEIIDSIRQRCTPNSRVVTEWILMNANIPQRRAILQCAVQLLRQTRHLL